MYYKLTIMKKTSIFKTIIVTLNGEQIDKIVEKTTRLAELKYNELLLNGYVNPVTQRHYDNCEFILL